MDTLIVCPPLGFLNICVDRRSLCSLFQLELQPGRHLATKTDKCLKALGLVKSRTVVIPLTQANAGVGFPGRLLLLLDAPPAGSARVDRSEQPPLPANTASANVARVFAEKVLVPALLAASCRTHSRMVVSDAATMLKVRTVNWSLVRAALYR